MATRKQTSANFQIVVAGITTNASIDCNSVNINANLNIQYQLNRQNGKIAFISELGEPDFTAIKAAIATELKAIDTEYATLIAVPAPTN